MSVADVALSPIHTGSGFSCGHFGKKLKHYTVESVLVFLSVSGFMIPMCILESDSIANLKLRIQKCKGFVVRSQKLVFSGRELARNSSLVKEYGITGGSVLHLVLKLSDLLLVTVRTTCGEVFEFHVDRHRDVGYLKKQISLEGKGFPDVDDQDICCNGEKLDDHKILDDICTDGNSVIHLLVKKSVNAKTKVLALTYEEPETKEDVSHGRDFLLEPVILNPKVKVPKAISDMINCTIDGLNQGNLPIRSSEGMGGSYLMPDSSGLHYVSVFKPMDEEPMAPNNPRKLPVSLDGQGLKRGTRVGEGALREVAAYILDHPKSGPRTSSNEEVMGFAGVPPTVMVRSLHKGYNYPGGFEICETNAKVGSLQMFMKNNGSCEDIGPGAFPVEEVHKICVFDIRMANADRHAGNILIKRDGGETVLIPIDHGYCLPETFEDCTYDWLYWPQAKEAFSEETLRYIESLDSEKDMELLRLHGWDAPSSVSRTLHISTMLLKKGAKRKLSAYEMGSMMCRETVKKESVMEEIVREAHEAVLPGAGEAAFLEAVARVMDRRLDQVKPLA